MLLVSLSSLLVSSSISSPLDADSLASFSCSSRRGAKLPPGVPFRQFFVTRAGILMKEENGPVLLAHVCLIWKHQLRQHVLVWADCAGELVLHDRTSVDIEGSYQDVLHMRLARVQRILRPESFRGPVRTIFVNRRNSLRRSIRAPWRRRD